MSQPQGDYITETQEALAMLGKGYEDHQQEIYDESDLRKYRIELPNLYDDSDLDPYEFRLLAHYKRVGRCTEGSKTTGKICKMSPSQVSQKRKSLADKGFIIMTRVDISAKEYCYKIIVVDKWRENFEKYSQMAPPSPREGVSPREAPPSLSALKNLHDDDFSKVVTYWMNTHTFLNPTHANLIGCMLDEWREHARLLPNGHPDKTLSPADVLIKAADVTAKHAQNPHSIAYMDRVVKNFIENGFESKKKSAPTPTPSTMPDMGDFDRKYGYA